MIGIHALERLMEEQLEQLTSRITSDVGDQVWNHGVRTLTNMGSDVAGDVWSYPNRTITAGGTSPSDIWSYADRTLTTAVLSDGTHLSLAEGTKGTNSIYDVVQSISGYDDENAFNIYVYSVGTTDPLIGAKGIIRNTSTGTAIQMAQTHELGKLTYTVNSGTYHLYMHLWGYSFDNPITLTVSDQTPTPAIVYGTRFNPSIVYPDCCTIYGQLVDFKLEEKQDISIVIYADRLPQFVSSVLLTNQDYTVLSSAEGTFEFYAIKGSRVNIKIESASIDVSVLIPTTDECNLIDLL